MQANRSIPDAIVVPELAYADVGAAVEWLTDKFGFQERLRIGDHRSQLLFGTGAVIVTRRRGDAANNREGPSSTLVRVNDLDRHYARSVEQGVRILRMPETYPFGERQYTAEDIGGHSWTFTQTIDDIDPKTWGGILR